jgi:hypothetical protein
VVKRFFFLLNAAFAMAILDLNSLAYLLENEEIPEHTKGDSDFHEPAAEGDIQLEYSPDRCAAQIQE